MKRYNFNMTRVEIVQREDGYFVEFTDAQQALASRDAEIAALKQAHNAEVERLRDDVMCLVAEECSVRVEKRFAALFSAAPAAPCDCGRWVYIHSSLCSKPGPYFDSEGRIHDPRYIDGVLQDAAQEKPKEDGSNG